MKKMAKNVFWNKDGEREDDFGNGCAKLRWRRHRW
jgi:hypothetical protein